MNYIRGVQIVHQHMSINCGPRKYLRDPFKLSDPTNTGAKKKIPLFVIFSIIFIQYNGQHFYCAKKINRRYYNKLKHNIHAPSNKIRM
jgi:hypothetical protein